MKYNAEAGKARSENAAKLSEAKGMLAKWGNLETSKLL